MSSRCDIFGDRIGSIEAGEELSFAQKVALECREDMCRLMYASRVHESELSFMMQTCGSGAITILCNTIVTVHLAGDDNELRYMTVLRAILRKTERLERIGYLKEFVNAAADLYNFYAGSKKNREDHPLSPLSLVLQSCSLLYIAEKYYYKSERHYVTAIGKAIKDLYACLSSPFLSKVCSYRACEGAGRGTLLLARYYYYNSLKLQCETSQLFKNALDYLESALKYAPSTDDPARRRVVKNSTVMYDLARVSCMLDKFDDAQKFLTNALHEKAIPPMSVYFVEPDFNFVRGATWFKGLGSANDSSSESVLKKTLLSMGFSLTNMGSPQGPIPERIYESGVEEYKRFLDKKENEERLEHRLQQNGLRVRDVPGDGNCQFYSISDQLYGDISHADEIRQNAVGWLRMNPDKEINGVPLSCFVFDETWDDFCDKVSRNGVWGDHLTLVAVANVYNLRILVISSVKGDNYMTEVCPDPPLPDREPPRQITISHFAELHYGSVVPL